MVTFKINQTTTVADLKEQFRKELGGTLRVYDGRSEAADEVTLVSLGAKEDEMECKTSHTVGKFCEDVQNTFNLKVKVFTWDNWVAVLDDITLATVRTIPNMSTCAKMEKYIAYKKNTEMKTDTKAKTVKLSKKYLDATILDIAFEEIDNFSSEKIDVLFPDRNADIFVAINVCNIDKFSGDFEQWVTVQKPFGIKKDIEKYIDLIPQKELFDVSVSYSSKFDIYCGSKCNDMWASALAEYGLGQYTGACHNPYDDVILPHSWPKGFGMAIFRVEWTRTQQVDFFEIDRAGTFELLDADIFEQVLEKRKAAKVSNG